MAMQPAALALAGLRGLVPRALAGAWGGVARGLHTSQTAMHVQAAEDEAPAAEQQAVAGRWRGELGAVRTDWTVSAQLPRPLLFPAPAPHARCTAGLAGGERRPTAPQAPVRRATGCRRHHRRRPPVAPRL